MWTSSASDETPLPLPDPWPGPAESLEETCRVTESGGKAETGWNKKLREPASLILISGELTALKAQVSHTMPAVKMNSPFNSNLNHKTRSYPKA